MGKIAEIATALECDARDLITPVKENAQGELMPPLWIMSAALFGVMLIYPIVVLIGQAVRKSKPPRGFDVLPPDETRKGK